MHGRKGRGREEEGKGGRDGGKKEGRREKERHGYIDTVLKYGEKMFYFDTDSILFSK